MRFPPAIARWLVLASATVMARPVLVERASGSPLEIRSLVVEDDEAANTRLTFVAYNPDPLANTTANCTGTWLHGSADFPKGNSGLRCGDSLFAWHFEGKFTDVKSFTIDLSHRFIDPAVGKPPYDRVSVFARGNFNESILAFETHGGKTVGKQADDKPVYLPIYATAA